MPPISGFELAFVVLLVLPRGVFELSRALFFGGVCVISVLERRSIELFILREILPGSNLEALRLFFNLLRSGVAVLGSLCLTTRLVPTDLASSD